MGAHRLTSLRHRRQQFDSQLTAELSSKQPDPEAMDFFATQRKRIADLIAEIEAAPAPAAKAVRTLVRPAADVEVEVYRASA